VVVVEARVHAAELRQAHRHVAVVEDDGHAEALAQRGRDAAEVRHRDREEDDGIDIPLALEQRLEMPAPAWCDVAPDDLPHRPVDARVVGALLGAAKVLVALEPRDGVACAGERLGLLVERVRRGSPPRRLDRLAAVGRDDQVDADVVQALPQLPPRRCAAVAEVEVCRRRDSDDFRCFSRHPCG
jgi:hypothetical protein